MAVFLRKYGTGTGADIWIPLIKRGVVDGAVGADFTPAAGDVKVSIDGAAVANIGTLPVALAAGNTAWWKFVFTDAELQGKRILISISDSATKAVEDQWFIIETYGHASAMYQADLSAANLPANVTQFGGTNGTFSGGRPEVNATHFAGTAFASAVFNANMTQISNDATAADNAESFFDGTGYAGVNNVIPTVTTLTNDPSGVTTLLSRLGTPSNLGGGATVAANLSDIESQTDDIGAAGAGLTAVPWNAAWDAEVQSECADALAVYDGLVAADLPANFSALAINVSGHVILQDASLVTAKLGTFVLAKTTHISGFNDLSAAQVNAEADTALADVGITSVITARIDAAITTRSTPAQVNAEVLDVLNVDTFAEPGQEAPPATTTLVKKIGYLFKSWRNKKTQTATERKLFADDGTTVDQKATDSDDATTFTKGELGTGP